MTGDKIRVLIVDDSATVRTALRAALDADPRIQVVAEACDGLQGVRMARALRPDVITMDVQMPLLDGLHATEEIMTDAPARILMVCSVDQQNEIDLSFKSIQAGALELIAKVKPGASSAADWGRKVAEAVRLMSEVAVVRRHRPRHAPQPAVSPTRPGGLQVIGIAASTGGPPVLATLLSALPADYPLPLLIVQHISSGFSAGLANWLNSLCKVRVELGASGTRPEPGHVYLAPDDHHLELGATGVLLTPPSGGSGACPSADRLFSSLAKSRGAAAVGIILTGMGEDGAQGLLELRQTGALTLGQDRSSCVVFGMPKVAAEKGAVLDLLSVDRLREFLLQFAQG
jgi:two-component system chemotaxis response regulator CheB